ncbi:oligopeptide/dipeptide ABC transporter ATP-binding protein, partial [Alcanivorax sp.]
ANPPAGCHFHERCPKAQPRCRRHYPPTLTLEDGRKVACWLFDR